jgi:hypothetical protein
MTTNQDFDRHAAAFLANGPTELADRVLDAALREVHTTRQRRGPAAPWRFPGMNTFFRLQAAALVAVVLVSGALVFIGPLLGPGGNHQTAAPSPSGPAATAACGHELVRGLYLTAGCDYRTPNFPPTFTIVSDGTWLDGFQTPNALDFNAITGPGLNTTVRLRPLRSVLADPCDFGSSVRRSPTPATAREYVDWLGGFIDEPAHAVEADALGLHGLRFDTGLAGTGPTPDPEDRCAIVSLSEASIENAPRGGISEAVGIPRTERVRVYVLDSPDGVFLAVLWMTDQPASETVGEAFLAGIEMQP